MSVRHGSPLSAKWSLRFRRVVPAVVGAVVIGAVAFWAGYQVRTPAVPVIGQSGPVTYRATVGTIGRTVPAMVTSTWIVVDTVSSIPGGTVTAEPPQGKVVDGGVVAWIDGLPLIAVVAESPFFRDLTLGSTGADVRAFEAFLARAKYLRQTPDPTFDEATQQAVLRWQESVGLPKSGIVTKGTIRAVREAGGFIRPTVVWGQVISPGESVAELLNPEPVLNASIEGTTPGNALKGSKITIKRPAEWSGLLGDSGRGVDGTLGWAVIGAEGKSICGDQCAELSSKDGVQLPGEIELIPQRSGVVVPTSAIRIEPDGTSVVVDREGVSTKVSVTVSDRGMALVEGIPEGAEVVLAPEAG